MTPNNHHKITKAMEELMHFDLPVNKSSLIKVRNRLFSLMKHQVYDENVILDL